MANQQINNYATILGIIIVIIAILLVALVVVYFTSRNKKEKKEKSISASGGSEEAKTKATSKVKTFAVESVIDFMEFEKVEDNMIIGKNV